MASMAEVGSSRLRAQDLTDRGLLVALVMTCLPNLKKLNVSMHDANQNFTQVLRLASQESTCEEPRRRAFQHVGEITLHTHHHDMMVDLVWPAFRLPRMRKVSLFNVPYRYPTSHLDIYARTSPVTHMALVYWSTPNLSYAATRNLFTLPKSLVHLSLYLHPFCSSTQDIHSVSNVELSRLLALHQDSLEVLDFYRQRPKDMTKFHSLTHTHMDLLRSFRALKTLMIHPEDLLGGCCGSPKASFRLHDTLPSNLGSLTFYAGGNLSRLPDVEEEIVEAVCNEKLAHLKTVVLEKTFNVKDPVDASWRTLRGACKKLSIDFHIADPDTLSKGDPTSLSS